MPELLRIIAHFQPQAWINDYAVDIDGAKVFDATEAVLRQDPEIIQRLIDDSYEPDDIASDSGVVGDHYGPFHVTISEAVDGFFRANGLAHKSVTEQDLAELRARYGVSVQS